MVMLAGLPDTYEPLVLGLIGAASHGEDAKISNEKVLSVIKAKLLQRMCKSRICFFQCDETNKNLLRNSKTVISDTAIIAIRMVTLKLLCRKLKRVNKASNRKNVSTLFAAALSPSTNPPRINRENWCFDWLFCKYELEA